METIVKEVGLVMLGAASGALIYALYIGMLNGGFVGQAVGNFLTGLTA